MDRSELHQAVLDKQWDLVLRLIDEGGDINAPEQRFGSSPMHFAVRCDVPLTILPRLISPSNINMQNKRGNSPLHEVVTEKRWDLVPLMIEHGADVNIGNRGCYYPLHFALTNHKKPPVSVVQTLATAESITATDTNQQQTALIQFCCQMDKDPNMDVLQMLLSEKIINVRDKQGQTALNHAITLASHQVQDMLLCHNAQSHLNDIIWVLTYDYDQARVRSLLQHLHDAPKLSQVHCKFNLTGVRMHLAINHLTMDMWRDPSEFLQVIIDLICYTLQQTCLLDNGTYTVKLGNLKPWYKRSAVRYAEGKQSEFENMARQAAPLRKLCMIVIRQNLLCKSDENFASLGLPAEVQSYLMLRDLADELDKMKRKRHEEVAAFNDDNDDDDNNNGDDDGQDDDDDLEDEDDDWE